MKVREIMKHEARFCTPETDLARAGRVMAEVGCGFLPIVTADNRVEGVVTDRDICLALTTRDQKPSAIEAREVMSGEVYSCIEEEEVWEALHTMRIFGVRRLVVLDGQGCLQGILSFDDIVLEAKALGNEEFTGPFYSDVAKTLKAICSHPMPAVVS